MTRPQPTEAAEYYSRYIDLIPSDEIVPTLQTQMGEFLEFLGTISEEQSLYSYAPGKWTIRGVLNHVSDCERLFLYRGSGSREASRTSCRVSSRIGQPSWPTPTTSRGLNWSRSSRTFGSALFHSSKTCPMRRGRGLESPATTRSRSERPPTSSRATSPTTQTS